MDSDIDSKVVDIFYQIGKVLLLVIMAAFIFAATDTGYTWLMNRPECVFKTATGLYCPSCGATRAAIAFMRGNIIRSFNYHPAIPYFFLAYAFFMARCFISRHFGKGKVSEKELAVLIISGAAIIVIQWAVKIVLQVVFNISYLCIV